MGCEPPPPSVASMSPPSELRVALSQLLPTIAKNLLLFNAGLAHGLAIFLIEKLHHANEGVSLDTEQISWYSGLGFAPHPFGSIASGFIVQAIGRKRSLLLINFPLAALWLLYYFSTAPIHVFCAVTLQGISLGLSEAPAKTYAGEICQPKYRGSFSALSGVFVKSGILLQVLLTALLPWRICALVCLGITAFSVVCIILVPESPHWLVSKGRLQDAEKALCWLRGWTTPDVVREEFHHILRYMEGVRTHEIEQEVEVVSVKNRVWKFFNDMIAPDTRRPFLLIFGCFVMEQLGGSVATNIYAMKILSWIKVPIKSESVMVAKKSMDLMTLVLLSSVIARFGKRRAMLASSVGTCVAFIVMGCYFLWDLQMPWVATVTFILVGALTNLGVSEIPWILLSEMFPYKTRGIAGGILSSTEHVMFFVSSKTFLSLVECLGVRYFWWLYACCGVVGVLFFYVLMPETEGKSFEEIEQIHKRSIVPSNRDKSMVRRQKVKASPEEDRLQDH